LSKSWRTVRFGLMRFLSTCGVAGLADYRDFIGPPAPPSGKAPQFAI
jgi:hypothetical protein